MMLTLSATLSPALSAAPPGSTHSTLAPCPQSSEATPTTRSPNLGQYSTMQYSTVQYSAAQYSTASHLYGWLGSCSSRNSLRTMS